MTISLSDVVEGEVVDVSPTILRADRQPTVWQRLVVFFGPKDLDKIVSGDEVCLAHTRLHWIVPLKHMAHMIISLPVAWLLSLILSFLLPSVWWVTLALVLSAVAHVLFQFYCVLYWWSDQVVVTNARFIRVCGVFKEKTDSRVLGRISDLTMEKSFWGKILNYGVFRIESGGRHDDGAERELCQYVPRPQAVYDAVISPLGK
jgi:hypothetical protein